MSEALDRLTAQFPRTGQVEWIGVRPERKGPMHTLERVLVTQTGLQGDHRATPGKRAITLIQAERLPVLASFTRFEQIDPAMLRRNIVVGRINLLALRKIEFRIGTAILRGTGPCAPCSRMEQALGVGGFNAMRGHGGITAEVIVDGEIAINDIVQV